LAAARFILRSSADIRETYPRGVEQAVRDEQVPDLVHEAVLEQLAGAEAAVLCDLDVGRVVGVGPVAAALAVVELGRDVDAVGRGPESHLGVPDRAHEEVVDVRVSQVDLSASALDRVHRGRTRVHSDLGRAYL
jgi:hypothetical protein